MYNNEIDIIQRVIGIYEIHNIWISVSMENDEADEISFGFSITKNEDNEVFFVRRSSNYASFIEAYNGAIEYCRTNLKLNF